MIKKILLIIISFSILLAISFIAINKFHAVREYKRTASKITVNISKTFITHICFILKYSLFERSQSGVNSCKRN